MSTILARTIDNNYIYADRSDKDGNGNNIASTYATQASVSAIRQVPASSSADEGKVLSVDNSGNAAWATSSVVPTAGNMLSTTNNVLNVTTTAGLTDIQLVQSMPASPVATVLYIIPEA